MQCNVSKTVRSICPLFSGTGFHYKIEASKNLTTWETLDGKYSNYLLYGGIADTMAAELRAWLTPAGADWNAKQVTYRSDGTTVPFLADQTPHVIVPFSQLFRLTTDDTRFYRIVLLP